VFIYLLFVIVKITHNLIEAKFRINIRNINILIIFAKIAVFDYIKIATIKASIAAAAILSICLLLFLTIGSFIVNTNMQQQALAQLPDHSYTPHTGIIHQVPERLTLSPLQPQR
jgi:hypothetical protein